MSNAGTPPTTAAVPSPAEPPGAVGSEAVWADIDRAYFMETRHNKTISELNNANNTNNLLTFQAGLLGLLLGGESDAGLSMDVERTTSGAGVPPANPTQPQGIS